MQESEDRLVFDGLVYISKDSQKLHTCIGCAFLELHSFCYVANCTSTLRADERDVIFIKEGD